MRSRSKHAYPRTLILSSLLLASTALSPAFAQASRGADLAPAIARGDLLQAGVTDALKPGEFEWLTAVRPASAAPVLVIVSLREQRAHVYRDGERIAVSTVSTGKPGHETPTGVFPILQKKKMHHSNLYDDAPMPYMQRLTWDGVALHAGRIPGHPASHGCVRLPKEFARQLFAITRHGQTVVVSEDGSVDALARAGLDQQLALLVGTSSTVREMIDAVDVEAAYAQEGGAAMGIGNDGSRAGFSR